MPVFLDHNHLLYNLLNVLIGGFHYAIHIWLIWRRGVMFDLELCVEFNDHSVVEVSTIVRDDYLGDAIPADKIMFYEPGDHILGTEANEVASTYFVK